MTTLRTSLLCSALALAAACWGAHAATMPPACPASIEVTEDLASPAAAPWAMRKGASTRHLVGVSFYDGPPDNEGRLTPSQDKATARQGERLASWTFSPGTTPVWLSCRYADTAITLNAPLPLATRTCTVKYEGQGHAKQIDCR